MLYIDYWVILIFFKPIREKYFLKYKPIITVSIEQFYEKLVENYNIEKDKLNTFDFESSLKEEESKTLEFKTSTWAQYHRTKGNLILEAGKGKKTEDGIIKTIAGFLNSEEDI